MLKAKQKPAPEIRRLFQNALIALMKQRLDVQVSAVRDNTVSAGGKYACLRAGKNLVIGVNDYESKRDMECILTHGLLLYDLRGIAGSELIIVLPQSIEDSVVERIRRRIACLTIPVELYQLSHYMVKLERKRIPALSTVLKETGPLLEAVNDKAYLGRLGENAPEATKMVESIKMEVPKASAHFLPGCISFRVNGLEFARLTMPQSRELWALHVGVGRKRKKLSGALPLADEARRTLSRTASPLVRDRSARGRKRSRYHRMQEERWLESLVLKDASVLGREFVQVATQVHCSLVVRPEGRNSWRRIDALGVEKGGRLWVMELKVAPDINAVFQAIDYWLWVEQVKVHLQEHGYFLSAQLNTARTAGILIVAPDGKHHEKLALIHKYVSSDVPLEFIRVSPDWKKGIEVM